MNRTIEIAGTWGTLYVDAADGKVTDYEPSAEGDEYKNIARVNLDEWREHYNASPSGCSSLDILDVGVFLDDGRYDPPEADWRREYGSPDSSSWAILCGPMGRVIP